MDDLELFEWLSNQTKNKFILEWLSKKHNEFCDLMIEHVELR